MPALQKHQHSEDEVKRIRIPVMAAVAALTLTAGVAEATGRAGGAPAPAPAPAPRAAAPMDHTGHQGPELVIPAGVSTTVFASCPAGRQPSGGGGIRSGKGLFMSGSSPRNNGWEVKFTNKSGAERRGSAFAVCTPQSHTRVAAANPLTVPAHSQSGISDVRCPEGQTPSGGGWEASSIQVIGMRFSASVGNYHAVLFNDTDQTQSFNAVALCSSAFHETRIGPQITVQPGAEGVATAKCGPGQRTSGGGSYPSGQAFIGDSRPLPDGTGWRITAENTTGTPQKVTAEATCTTS
ncbi:hypothetical protein [Streptomyces alboflavus]|uniref:hypothetical protein n=1 Tax=Streptomyces alboflavus TaxID=67267 RepID=UPI0004C2AAD4|nr:hypothetical protein [Streptomyces alboflavus]